MARRKNWQSGNIVEVVLPDGSLSYGMVINFPRIAFFHGRYNDRPQTSEILNAEVAFQICVMRYAISKKFWAIVSDAPVPEHLLSDIRFYRCDALTKEFSIYHESGVEEPATFEEVKDLECAAVWDPEHVVSRLEDLYAGRKNDWVEQLAAKKN